jgi:predicted dehydrogenase
MPFYNRFTDAFRQTAIHYHVEGSLYGLVTNAIHYLDHIAHLTGETDFVLDTSYLNKTPVHSKRPGFYDLTGTLIARFNRGSLAWISCHHAGTAPIQIEIYNHEHRMISRESEHKAWCTSVHQDWVWSESPAPIPFQSTLTADLAHALITTNQCALPDYETSMKLHLQLLAPLNAFLTAHSVKSDVDYPFT